MDMEPVVSLGSSQRAWAAELTRFLSDHGGARLQGTVITAVDAVDQDYEVLIIDDIASYLSPRFIDRIQRLHRRIIGVYDPDGGEAGRERLLGMGVDAVVEADAGPDEFLQVIASLRGSEGFGEATIGPPAPTPITEARRADPIVVVAGGDLATEVAIALADVSAGKGLPTVVVDADTVNPTLAQRLGLPLVPNLLSALDAHIQLRGIVEDSLIQTLRGYHLLLGLPEPQEWDSVDAADVADLIGAVAAGAGRTIVKIDPHVEDLAGLSSRQGRFDVSRSVLSMANDVVVLTDATPIGLARTLAWVARAVPLTVAPVHVAFERAPGGLYQRGELSEELVRSFMPASITWLPDDGRIRKAAWNGEVVPPGPFMKAVAGLAAKLGSSLPAGAR